MPRGRVSSDIHDALSGAGNTSAIDDRPEHQGQGHPRQKSSSWSLPEALYDISMTYTKMQRLTRNAQPVSYDGAVVEATKSVSFLTLACSSRVFNSNATPIP